MHSVLKTIFSRNVVKDAPDAQKKTTESPAATVENRKRRDAKVNGGDIIVAVNSSASTPNNEKSGIGGEDVLFPNLDKDKLPTDDMESKRIGDRYRYVYKRVGPNDTKLTLHELKHYSAYTIHVKACREGIEDNCSVETSMPARTKKMGMFGFCGFCRVVLIATVI